MNRYRFIIQSMAIVFFLTLWTGCPSSPVRGNTFFPVFPAYAGEDAVSPAKEDECRAFPIEEARDIVLEIPGDVLPLVTLSDYEYTTEKIPLGSTVIEFPVPKGFTIRVFPESNTVGFVLKENEKVKFTGYVFLREGEGEVFFNNIISSIDTGTDMIRIADIIYKWLQR